MGMVWCDGWDRVGGSGEEDDMRFDLELRTWALLLFCCVLLYRIYYDEKDIREIRARINAIEATVEPIAYFSVDFDNRLAKAEGAWRLEEEDENYGK